MKQIEYLKDFVKDLREKGEAENEFYNSLQCLYGESILQTAYIKRLKEVEEVLGDYVSIVKVLQKLEEAMKNDKAAKVFLLILEMFDIAGIDFK